MKNKNKKMLGKLLMITGVVLAVFIIVVYAFPRRSEILPYIWPTTTQQQNHLGGEILPTTTIPCSITCGPTETCMGTWCAKCRSSTVNYIGEGQSWCSTCGPNLDSNGCVIVSQCLPDFTPLSSAVRLISGYCCKDCTGGNTVCTKCGDG